MAEVTQLAGDLLSAGASAIDVVERAVMELESSGLYVAGRGSGANVDGQVELDASIMDGARRRAGGVAAVHDLISPISAARRVMEESDYVLLTGRGADIFASNAGLDRVTAPSTYYRLAEGVVPEEIGSGLHHGTVGSVALDKQGRLAAATSTGGLFSTHAGRVGDTALIGAGTWADQTIAISCTGIGEHFILAGGAQRVATRIAYADHAPQAAIDDLLDDVASLGGDGGIIAMSAKGKIIWAFNSPGMKRASIGAHSPLTVAVF